MDYANINDFDDCDDFELAMRMRRSNYEKFKSLVRMHLSFELDLNTDEFDLPCHEIVYEDKGKLKKWNRFSKKHKHIVGTAGCTTASTSKNIINSPTETLHQQIDAGFLMHFKELKEFLLLEKNLTQEGIFRKTGAVSRQNELRLHIQNDKPLQLEQAGYSAHDCATVFKGFLAELPEPLLTDALYPAHLQIAPLCLSAGKSQAQHLLNSVQLLLLLLPEENRELLQHIIEMLHAVTKYEKENKMNANNLATLFAPHLICPRNLPPEVLHYTAKKMSSIIAYMIALGTDVFKVPGKLNTDIRAYFLERKRKKTMSPEQTLDDSISDISTVNTVYTFVDRAATAAATNTNNTDTELAQLYAHIQSLPESSNKRRLIKQFNKQNGHGTPLQFVVKNRLKNNEATRSAKSLGDSIKKHIFHKARTPKRNANMTMTPIRLETPNSCNLKQAKSRVLFQSPTASTTSSACLSSNSMISTTACTTTNYAPYNIKTHPLQKSISSTSLLKVECSTSSTSLSSAISKSNVECIKSISAPVSRQHSNDLPNCENSSSSQDAADICCVTPLKIMSAAAKQLMGVNATVDKKTVAWDDNHLHEIEEYSNSCTPIQQNSSDLKSRYKSEPNLSCILPHRHIQVVTTEAHELTPINKTAMGSKSLTRKLIKGVSMGNLRFPFSTPESTKRLVRSVSATLKRRPSDETQAINVDAPLLEDVDDSDFDDEIGELSDGDNDDGDDDNEGNDKENAKHGDLVKANLVIINPIDDGDDTLAEEISLLGAVGVNNTNSSEKDESRTMAITTTTAEQIPAGIYRNMDLITSTPSMILGRRSMSPITKSAQRMPKAMQESIMTPRSRKPVMVLTITNSDPNQTLDQTALSSFREQDEENSLSVQAFDYTAKHNVPSTLHCGDILTLGAYSDILRRQHIQQQFSNMLATKTTTTKNVENYNNNSSSDAAAAIEHKDQNALTNEFKEYLLTRSVLTASPVDSSFSSQPDDFGGTTGSTQEIDDLNESQLSPSLLCCLDGNEPDHDSNNTPKKLNEATTQSNSMPAAARSLTSLNNSMCLLNNARKRAAANNDDNNLQKLHNNITPDLNDLNLTANKENYGVLNSGVGNVNSGYLRTTKLLITEYPGETAL